MAESAITVQNNSLSGLEATYEAANVDGNSFANDGKTFLHVKNGSGSDITATVDSQTACSQGFDHDAAAVISAGEERMIGPFAPSRFNDEDGLAHVSYSDVTSLTVAAISNS